MVKFNINNYVYFKITEIGKKHWEENFNKYPVDGYTFDMHFKQYTKRGWTKMQMWCFMELFGQSIGISSPLMFETDIRFDESDFKK